MSSVLSSAGLLQAQVKSRDTHSWMPLKGGPSDLGTKILQNTKKSSVYSQSLLIFIYRAPVVERRPITREIRNWLTPTRNTVYFYIHEQLVHLYTENTQAKPQT